MKQDIIRIDLQGVNGYLGKQGDCFILFDAGGHLMIDKQFTNRRELLIQQLDNAGCNPDNLGLIVLTHGDYDHTANAAFIKEKYQTKIAMHVKDAKLVESPDIDTVMKSFHFKSIVYKMVLQIMKKKIKLMTQKILNDFEAFTPDILLNDGDSLSEYGFDATILHIPGHTFGSIAILTEQRDLIAGDTLANNKTPATAPNAIDFSALNKSIKRLQTLDIKTVYPGHGLPFEMAQLKKI